MGVNDEGIRRHLGCRGARITPLLCDISVG